MGKAGPEAVAGAKSATSSLMGRQLVPTDFSGKGEEVLLVPRRLVPEEMIQDAKLSSDVSILTEFEIKGWSWDK